MTKDLPDHKFYTSISHTTRPKRPGEQEGVHYFYVSEEKFKELIAADEFLEHAEVFGNFYGTSKRIIQEKLNEGYDILLDIDWQGARNVRRAFPQAFSVFVLPPSITELKQRLLMRNTDSLDVIERRMAKAEAELSHQTEYDLLLVNDDLEKATEELIAFIHKPFIREDRDESYFAGDKPKRRLY